MAKQVSCADVGNDCDFTAWAETEEELMELVAAHAKHVHGMDQVPPELAERLRAVVREV